MAKTITTMRDSNGHDIPLKYVSKYDKLRDKTARKILARFTSARAMLEKVVVDTIADLETLRNSKEKLGEKGNFSACSFDGLIQVAIRQQYNIKFDERVAHARELMMEYVSSVLDKVENVDVAALKMLIDEAFKANNDGILSTGRVMALLRMEVNDPKWREAKAILSDSMKPQKGKQYLHCETRPSIQQNFSQIRLDIADCWPIEPVSEPPKK